MGKRNYDRKNEKTKKACANEMLKHKQAQKDLEKTYLNEQQKQIQCQIERTENASENKQSSLAWQNVNEITEKKIKKGQNKSIQPRRTLKEMNEQISESSWQITYCI